MCAGRTAALSKGLRARRTTHYVAHCKRAPNNVYLIRLVWWAPPRRPTSLSCLSNCVDSLVAGLLNG